MEAELCFPQVNNSCRRKIHSHFETSVIETTVFCITVITVVLNLLVIISISHYRQLHATTTNHLLLSLAVSDFIVGFPLMPFLLLHSQGCLRDDICTLDKFLGYLTISVSVGNMVLISADRYMAVCYPMIYHTRVTVKRVQLCVCLCWMCAAVHSTWMVRDYLTQPDKFSVTCYGECLFLLSVGEKVYDLAVTLLAPFAVIILLYIRVFAVAVSQARAIRSHAVRLQRSETVKAKKPELKAARTLFVVVAVFFLCSSPFYCSDVAFMRNVIDETIAGVGITLLYFNSCLNPVMYVSFYPWFRKAIKHIVTLQILKPGSRQTNLL